MWIAAVLAFGIGVLLGLLGGGGSILAVPLMVYVLKMETKMGIATSLVLVGASSAAAALTHARAGRVRWRTGLLFGVTSMAGAFAGARMGHWVPGSALLLGFILIMLVTGLAMLRGRRVHSAPPAQTAWLKIGIAGVAVGLMTGLVGAGGGFVIVPALALLAGLTMPEAIATSLFVIALNSLAGVAGSYANLSSDLPGTALMVMSAIVGGIAGGMSSARVPEKTLRVLFAWFVLAMALWMLWQQTSPGWVVAAAAVVGAGVLILRRGTSLAVSPVP